MLHDIGMSIDYDDHHKHSRYLILNGGLPGFSPVEMAIIAQAARYHRKGMPDARAAGGAVRRGRRRAPGSLRGAAAPRRGPRALARSAGPRHQHRARRRRGAAAAARRRRVGRAALGGRARARAVRARVSTASSRWPPERPRAARAASKRGSGSASHASRPAQSNSTRPLGGRAAGLLPFGAGRTAAGSARSTARVARVAAAHGVLAAQQHVARFGRGDHVREPAAV